MLFRRKKNVEEGVNPTPLVDVMFNLLIFIIVTAQYSNVQAMKVKLPGSESGSTVEKGEQITIGLTQQEQVFYNGAPTSLTGLETTFALAAKQTEQPAVYIQADEASSTGSLVKVMDLASKAGLKKISIETKKASQ